MLPILIKIGDFPVHTYGFMIAIGFLLCVWVAKKEAKRQNIASDRVVDLAFWSLLIGMLGSRILYVITLWSYYLEHPIEIFYIWEGGLVFWGGPLACIPFFFWYTKHFELPRWKVIDIGAQSLPLAHAFGRLGCFAAGCCFGKPTGGEWGVKLHSLLVEPPSLRGIYLHPVQLYESGSLFVLFFTLRRLRFHKKFDGEIGCAYLIMYSIIRSITEIYRGDSIRGFVIEDLISTSQFISMIVIAATLVFYFNRRKTRNVQ